MIKNRRGGFGFLSRFEETPDWQQPSSASVDNTPIDLTVFKPRELEKDEQEFRKAVVKILEKFKLAKGTS